MSDVGSRFKGGPFPASLVLKLCDPKGVGLFECSKAENIVGLRALGSLHGELADSYREHDPFVVVGIDRVDGVVALMSLDAYIAAKEADT